MTTVLNSLTSGTKRLWRTLVPSTTRTGTSNAAGAEAFQKSISHLLAAPLWTYGAMRHYQEQMLELTGAHSLQSRVSGESELTRKLRKNIKILEAMSARELASNHKEVFTAMDRRLIAEKAGVELDAVDNLIREHDMLRADRRWYKIRMQFNRPLPRTPEEREVLATRDRPLSETEKQILKEEQNKQVNKYMGKMKMQYPKPVTNLFFRHPSKGFDRWRTTPPKNQPRFTTPRVKQPNKL